MNRYSEAGGRRRRALPAAAIFKAIPWRQRFNAVFLGSCRHCIGSNWFWYCNSPWGCHVEYDADMDLHDENGLPRTAPVSADTTQLFLFQHREKWFPAGTLPKQGVG